ncbi:MAG: DUF421 domain-containing protein [Bacilli bacterium]|nr:DUF421 domain-containing protein [Bacilli bacterium]
MSELLLVLLRTIFFYFFVTFLYRMMGKREIGELSITDLTISILMAELVAISIEETDKSMLQTILPLMVLTILEILLAFFSMKFRRFHSFFEGKPSLIIVHGNLNYKEMIRQRYSLDDLLLAMRQKGLHDLSEVEYAFLETNGKLSIFPYQHFHLSSDYPIPVIVDGVINESTLEQIGKTKTWLEQELAFKHLTRKNVFYAFYKKKRIYFIQKDSTS